MPSTFEQFGCQTVNDCNQQLKFEEIYQKTGMEDFNIPPARMLMLCLHAQKRLKELADFAGKDYGDFVREFANGSNCPFQALSVTERVNIPTLLE